MSQKYPSLLDASMAVNAFKIAFLVILVFILSLIFTLGWQSSWQSTIRPGNFSPKFLSGRGFIEQQASFDNIRSFFHDLTPHNLSIVTVKPLAISSRKSKNHGILDVAKPDAVSPLEASKPETNASLATTSRVQEEECGPPKTNILFFKMHKCSSSTVQNILMRYGDKHNLNFVLPPKGNYLGHSEFSSRAMLKFPVREYNILCHHTRFSFTGMSKVMPKDTVWTTIVREPVDMFESTFYYRNLGQAFGIKTQDPLATFSLDPSHYVAKHGHLTLARDPMMYDLGLSDKDKGNVEATEKLLSHLDKVFDLVLITEHFEESLILLRDLMCWQTDDVVSFVVNARAKSSVHGVREDVRRRLLRWNVGDAMLYDHFNKTLWKKVEAYGTERMEEEVALLKTRNQELNDRCILDPAKTVNQGGIWHPKGVDIQGLVLREEAKNDALCKGMAMAELPFTNYLLQKQKKKYGMS